MDTFRDHVVISFLALISGFALIPFAKTAGLSDLLSIGLVPFLLIVENAALAVARYITAINTLPFVRYGANGLFNTAIDMCFVLLFSIVTSIYTGWTLLAFNAASFVAVNVFSFFMNRSWVFKVKTRARFNEFLSFALVLGSSLLLNSALLFILTTLVDRGMFSESQWVALAKSVAIIACLMWNFVLFRYFVFPERLRAQEAA